MTKKKPIYRYGNHKGIETKGDANGEVKTYFLDPVEYQRYLSMPKLDWELEKKLNRSMMGGNDAS